METPTDGFVPVPQAQPTPAPSGFRAIWILWGCGGMAVALLLLLGSCFLAIKSGVHMGEKKFGPTCEHYLAQIQAGDFPGAYQEFGPAMTSTTSLADYLAFEHGMQEKLGALRSKTVQFVGTGYDQGGQWGRLTYGAVFEKGEATIKFELRKYGNTFKIIGIHYESPLLAQTPKTAAS